MEAIKDRNGRIICQIDRQTGLIETKYRRCKTSVRISVGEVFTILKEGTITYLRRTRENDFTIVSVQADNEI